MASPRRVVGRCPALFLLAVMADVVGLGLILIGIFVNLEMDGRSFGEFLIYTGGIMLFFSLLSWLAWYTFNLEVSMQELMMDPSMTQKKSNIAQIARKFSERFSRRAKRKDSSRDTLRTPNQPGEPLHLTPSVFINNGFSSPLDSLRSSGNHLELSTVSCLDGNPKIAITQHIVDKLV
ncbi:transmembrane protein 238-like [Pelobates fuscus]|uniref:transmembrane protein 238-like n=1 Tax=Pelobates fuscus TaxID=191477 RepID=UPI002FE47A74